VTQAVAAARLGLDVSLFAAVADDHFGEEIMNYLERENVDTRLVKVVAGGRSPFTGIIELELGDSAAVNWRNDREVRIDVRDVEERASALADCDAALVTFELPRESMQRVLAVLDRAEPRPTVIVTPSQPYSEGVVPGQAFAQIDYLVAHPWELGRYAPSDQPAFKPDEVAVRMLANGVKTVCYPIGGGCSVYSEGPLGTFAVPSFPTQYRESSAARDAFCAALAAKLIEEHGAFSEGIALWATAAMAAAAADYPLQNPMPDRNRIEGMLSRSRFLVAPRADLNGAAGGGLPG
jgi:ribokinase